MNDQLPTTLSVVMKPDQIGVFYPLLQQGFQVKATVGCDIHALLCDQFGMLPEYLSDRINTIFLNGKPVDEVKSAIVENGATLALSAAMPGLVGATFRKAGCLAAFRGSITYQTENDRPEACHEGFVTLKLFNLLVSEIGPSFLAHGIWIRGQSLQDCLRPHLVDAQSLFTTIKKDNAELLPEQMESLDWIAPRTQVILQVTCEP